MKSSLFYTNEYTTIAQKVVNFLNAQEDFLSSRTASSTRAAGDAIQELLSRDFPSIMGSRVKEYKNNFSRKAIEFLSWDCLTLGALGWGQIQIADAKKIFVVRQDRKRWMLKLCDKLLEFYPSELEKIKKVRIEYFKKVKNMWLAKY